MLPLNYVIFLASLLKKFLNKKFLYPENQKKLTVDDLYIGFNSIILWFFENA